MSYQIIPTVIFILAVLGIVLIILRHLPEAAAMSEEKTDVKEVQQRIEGLGLPAVAISKVRAFFKWWGKKIWNFALEAKDLKPASVTGYKIKKIFGGREPLPATKPLIPPPVQEIPRDENYFLEQIKKDPKNFSNYDSLGRFYLDKGSFSDAKDIYLYLVNHEPASADFQARLAYALYKLKEYTAAGDHYQKSLTLDSTQPNRYYNLGLCREAEGKLKEALEAFTQALELEHKNPKFFIAQSNVYAKMGNKRKAKESLGEAIKLDPQNMNLQVKMQQIK